MGEVKIAKMPRWDDHDEAAGPSDRVVQPPASERRAVNALAQCGEQENQHHAMERGCGHDPSGAAQPRHGRRGRRQCAKVRRKLIEAESVGPRRHSLQTFRREQVTGSKGFLHVSTSIFGPDGQNGMRRNDCR